MALTPRHPRWPHRGAHRNDPEVVRAHFLRGIAHGITLARAMLAAALGGLVAMAVVGLLIV